MATKKAPNRGSNARPPRSDARGPRAPKKAGPSAPLGPPPPRQVGGARNEHGTRIARRIACTRCGKVDHIARPPRDLTRALCRACATEVLMVFEETARLRPTMKDARCILCDTPFQLPAHIAVDDALCPDCLRGFSSWQGALETDFEERREAEPRRTGVRLRRPKAEGGKA
jgi:hypothetical protein